MKALLDLLKNAVFSNEYGFIVDYLAEIFRELRKTDLASVIEDKVVLDGSLTTRDKDGIRKSFSGLMKIIYPNKVVSDEEFFELLDFSIEGRKRVKDQLYKIDETFKSEPADFMYTIKMSGKEVRPETLENLNYLSEIEVRAENTEEENTETERKVPELKLEPHQTIIKDNQTGLSYKRLFAAYLLGAKSIKIQDPFIRLPYQMNNLLEFCVMLGDIKGIDEEVDLEVVTWNNEEFMLDSVQLFEDLQSSVLDLGINLTVIFEEHHDRYIEADNGWKITLGRGLDIFEKIEGRFNVASLDQTKRKCKSCEMTYVRLS